MRIVLKQVLDIDPDSAWRALQSPAVFREVSSPLMSATSLEGGFPTQWRHGVGHEAALDALGVVPVGAQSILVDERRTSLYPDVRILRDSGIPIAGALKLITAWEHKMAVSPTNDGRTLYRDQLTFSAGPATLAVWPAMWAFWQWRAAQLRRLAPGWRYDRAADVVDDTPLEPAPGSGPDSEVDGADADDSTATDGGAR